MEESSLNMPFHHDDHAVLSTLERDARRLAARFGLRLASLDRESPRVKRRYGSCDSDGVIRIRLRNRRNGDYLKYSSLVATLCHELAHLRFMDHGLEFRALYMRILDFARATEIYRPRAVAARGEVSLRRAALNPRRARRGGRKKPRSAPR
jgi:hypothetical protein